MKLEIGATYIDRHNRQVTITRYDITNNRFSSNSPYSTDGTAWRPDGTSVSGYSEYDLVMKVNDGPLAEEACSPQRVETVTTAPTEQHVVLTPHARELLQAVLEGVPVEDEDDNPVTTAAVMQAVMSGFTNPLHVKVMPKLLYFPVWESAEDYIVGDACGTKGRAEQTTLGPNGRRADAVLVVEMYPGLKTGNCWTEPRS